MKMMSLHLMYCFR